MHSTSWPAERSRPDVGNILRLIRKRKWMILAISVAVPTVVGLASSKQTPIYQASASIVIDITVPQYLGTGFRDVVEIEPSWWSSRENLETEFRVLRSDSQAVAVARALCDRKLSDGRLALQFFLPNTSCTSPSDFQLAARMIQASLRVDPVKDSRIVTLSVTGTNARGHRRGGHTAANVYLERNLDRRLSQSRNAATWLGSEYGDLATQLQRRAGLGRVQEEEQDRRRQPRGQPERSVAGRAGHLPRS
jgi:uncharacterized protein involved in exopolysaccharide biosynthesis